MQYFVRTVEKHKTSTRVFSPELPYGALGSAKDAARRIVQTSDPSVMLQADVCSRNRNQVRTRYCCWINERGEFVERALI